MSEIKKETKTKPKKKVTTSKKVKEVKPATKKKEVKKVVVAPVKEEKKEKKVVVKAKKVKEEKGILCAKEKKYYKVLSKIIAIVSKIGRICLMILVPFIFLAMILVPILFKNFEVNGNIIKFGDVGVVVANDKISLNFGNEVEVINCDTNEIEGLLSYVNNHSKTSIIFFVELSLLVFGTIIVMYIYLLSYQEKLFRNFSKEDTPFTEENTKHIFNIAVLLVVIKIISLGFAIFSNMTYHNNSYGIVELLIVFVIYFVFKYATGIQKDSTKKITD